MNSRMRRHNLQPCTAQTVPGDMASVCGVIATARQLVPAVGGREQVVYRCSNHHCGTNTQTLDTAKDGYLLTGAGIPGQGDLLA